MFLFFDVNYELIFLFGVLYDGLQKAEAFFENLYELRNILVYLHFRIHFHFGTYYQYILSQV